MGFHSGISHELQSPQEVNDDVKAKTHEDAALADELRARFDVRKGSFSLLLKPDRPDADAPVGDAQVARLMQHSC